MLGTRDICIPGTLVGGNSLVLMSFCFLKLLVFMSALRYTHSVPKKTNIELDVTHYSIQYSDS